MRGERSPLAAAEAAEERGDEAGSAAAVAPDPEVEEKPACAWLHQLIDVRKAERHHPDWRSSGAQKHSLKELY